MESQQETFALLTAARNEQATIEKTIVSVISQSTRPAQWLIISDTSTDHTDKIISSYAKDNRFIKHIILESGLPRGVSAKVNALRVGYDAIDIPFDFIGCIDADISFAGEYFSHLLGLLRNNPRLGLTGGEIWELIGTKFYPQPTSDSSVAGAVQFFRRECFEQIGGYRPISYGGEDAAAEIMARYFGWETACCRGLKVFHHRRVSMGSHSMLSARFRQGRMDYALGYNTIFELARCGYRLLERPYFLGSIFRVAGFVSSAFLRDQRALPNDVIQFLRDEQAHRLRAIFTGVVSPRGILKGID